MKEISRRQFTKNITIRVGCISMTLAPGMAFLLKNDSNLTSGDEHSYAILPIDGHDYSDSLKKLMKNSQFSTIEQALRAIRDPMVPYKIKTLTI